jgi:hypothetical protein
VEKVVAVVVVVMTKCLQLRLLPVLVRVVEVVAALVEYHWNWQMLPWMLAMMTIRFLMKNI